VNLGVLRCLIRGADTRKLGDLALPRLLVQTLGVTRLSNLEQIAGCLAVGLVWRDERGNGNCGRVGEEFGDLEKVKLVIAWV
jgi:hypothetical protein